MSKHLVTGVRPFNFVNDDGEHVQGVTVHYLSPDHEDTDFMKGHAALNLTLIGGSHAEKFKEVPGIYELEFRQTSDNRGRPQIKLKDAFFLEPFNLAVTV